MQKDSKSKSKLRIPYASRMELIVAAILGCVNITLAIIIFNYVVVDAAALAIAFTLIYLAEVAIIGIRHASSAKVLHNKSIHQLLSEDGSVVLKTTSAPVIAFDSLGTVLWYNEALRSALGDDINYIGSKLSDALGTGIDKAIGGDSKFNIGRSLYSAQGFKVSDMDGGLYLLVLEDVTRVTELEKAYNDERVVVAYIAIDNVEDVLQYIHEKFADAVSKIDDKLKSWAAEMNGVIKSYDNDKYVMFFDSAKLDECIANRFAILDEIRDARVGDGVSITVSIGVARGRGSLAERELAARDAIDMALQRGGDQAVYNSEEETVYFGGRTKSVYKRSNVRSRAFASQLTALMARSDNVIVMGHRYGDFDSFGATIGIARLASLCGVKVNIAVDMRDKNLLPCIQLMQSTEFYSQMFVDNAEALDLIGTDTLVVLADHNTVARAQFSDVAGKASKIAIIDHHRKTVAHEENVAITYIEPSASSSCELVTEMLESAVSSQNLMKEEADIILSGILLDTKQFTRNTGTRTFGAAQYLRGAGANPTDVYNLFKTLPEDLSKEARFHTGIITYRENIAISCCDGDTDESYRVIASKAADKMLTLKGIDAAFTLVRIGDRIHISGRSNGSINVQLILEKLNGGGHYDVAGAQVESESVFNVLERLKSSIDEYIVNKE